MIESRARLPAHLLLDMGVSFLLVGGLELGGEGEVPSELEVVRGLSVESLPVV